MYIKDYDFITKDIGALFEREVIVYGAGYIGKRTAMLLEDAGVKISCFCDQDEGRQQYMGYPVIDWEEMKNKAICRKCVVIIASIDYCDEIAKDLQKEQIGAYVITWYGLQVGIELNVEDVRFSKEFCADMREKKKMRMELFSVFAIQGFRFRKFYEMPDAVLVYQPGKVGSQTIHCTLQKEKIDSIHTHYIMTNRCGNHAVISRQIAYFHKQLIQKWEKGRKLKVITLIREPMAEALAWYMQDFEPDMVTVPTSKDLAKCAQEYIQEKFATNYEFEWFDKELKKLTGIDIFQYPFDKEKGYAWIKTEKVEILVLKMEQMNENEGVVGAFVGKPDLKYANNNIGAEKPYKYIYEELKRVLRIPKELLRGQYEDNRLFRHFYTQEEIDGFWKKWSGNLV